MPDNNVVITEKRDGLTILRLNQPEKMNALSLDIKAALGVFIPQFFSDQSARCLMITGTGSAFCAGGDIRNMTGDQPSAVVRARITGSHDGWARHLLQGEKPVVMAVNGAAAGAGFALAMLGDLVLASTSAYFLAGFASVGAVADMGLAATLPRAVGVTRAKEILFGNAKVTSARAEQIGMVNAVFPDADFEEKAIAYAMSLARGPTVGLGLTKTLIRQAYDADLSTLLQSEAAMQVIAFATEDRAEGAAAFLERRKPTFKGR
ncbi:MAG: enoyl-CoA hydratase/isomerase family protein [Mesorhizobium sp.]|nr:enoyl-CoA hydratase/isomerase family protein [Mesorhizobium sp.]